MFKSIAVVIGSYALSVVLVFATNPLLSWMYPGEFISGNIPSTIALGVSTLFFFVISIFSAFVCAHWSPVPVSRHVLWFFLLGEILGVVAAIANWGNGWPHWYPLSWVIIWPLACWIGYLGGRRRTA